ncbi:MAG: hypothetical protein JWL71_1381 [Acidobacteria bacterium]|nr:hypothetical protein [Acidobacteriota bacterium]
MVSVADGPDAGKSAMTDFEGTYSIAALQQSAFTVTVSAANYLSASKGITLTANQQLSFQLHRSVYNFQGAWVGPWVRQSCADTGSLVGFCAVFNGGVVALQLTQTGTTAQGTLVGLGSSPMNVSGPIGTTGTLTLTGQSVLNGFGTVTLSEWQSQGVVGAMSGSFTFMVLSRGEQSPGNCDSDCDLRPCAASGLEAESRVGLAAV